jgi:acyl-CoA reductase-like NAD-dependent aldehyde dehydrogenase/nicotinamidase-related amidase
MGSEIVTNRNKQTACLLVDLQNDYLERVNTSHKSELIKAISELLYKCRNSSVPVLHIRTLVKKNGGNRMPHHKKKDKWICVDGTHGSAPPEKLMELTGEQVFYKKYFSAFSNPDLNNWLRSLKINNLIISGLYTHACIRATILDAYQLGYDVLTSEEIIYSDQEIHSRETVKWLGDRACKFNSLKDLLFFLENQFEIGKSSSELLKYQKQIIHQNEIRDKATIYSSGYVRGQWLAAGQGYYWVHRNPSNWDKCLGYVPICGDSDVENAIKGLKSAQNNWVRRGKSERLTLLQNWASVLESKKEAIIDLLTLEIGKPTCDGEKEYAYGMNLFKSSLDIMKSEVVEKVEKGIKVAYRPLGTVALITPWNNPFAIPLGKIVPALAYGNTILWKPALHAPGIVSLIINSMKEAGINDHCLHQIFGDSGTGQLVAAHPEIDAISFTGSIHAGLILSKIAAYNHKKYQSEMGGNNAAIIGNYSDMKRLAKDMAESAFSFSGQRCTVPRRFILLEDVSKDFTEYFVQEVRGLKIGLPNRSDVNIGPLISRDKQNQIQQLVNKSVESGARLLLGGSIPENFKVGCWFSPTILSDVELSSDLFQEETFGPVAVLMSARTIDEALDLCNNVSQGLSASIYSEDKMEIGIFLERAKAGILRVNESQGFFHSLAPFGGWKLSGAGSPEHGRWDREFYTQVQAIYTSEK